MLLGVDVGHDFSWTSGWLAGWLAGSGHMNGTWPGCDSGHNAKAASPTKANRIGLEWHGMEWKGKERNAKRCP